MKRGIEVGPTLLVKRGCCQGGGRKGQCEDGQRTWTWKKQWFEGEGGCCFAQNTLQWLPSREENCNFLAVSLSLSARFQLLVAENLGCAAI